MMPLQVREERTDNAVTVDAVSKARAFNTTREEMDISVLKSLELLT